MQLRCWIICIVLHGPLALAQINIPQNAADLERTSYEAYGGELSATQKEDIYSLAINRHDFLWWLDKARNLEAVKKYWRMRALADNSETTIESPGQLKGFHSSYGVQFVKSNKTSNDGDGHIGSRKNDAQRVKENYLLIDEHLRPDLVNFIDMAQEYFRPLFHEFSLYYDTLIEPVTWQDALYTFLNNHDQFMSHFTWLDEFDIVRAKSLTITILYGLFTENLDSSISMGINPGLFYEKIHFQEHADIRIGWNQVHNEHMEKQFNDRWYYFSKILNLISEKEKQTLVKVVYEKYSWPRYYIPIVDAEENLEYIGKFDEYMRGLNPPWAKWQQKWPNIAEKYRTLNKTRKNKSGSNEEKLQNFTFDHHGTKFTVSKNRDKLSATNGKLKKKLHKDNFSSSVAAEIKPLPQVNLNLYVTATYGTKSIHTNAIDLLKTWITSNFSGRGDVWYYGDGYPGGIEKVTSMPFLQQIQGNMEGEGNTLQASYIEFDNNSLINGGKYNLMPPQGQLGSPINVVVDLTALYIFDLDMRDQQAIEKAELIRTQFDLGATSDMTVNHERGPAGAAADLKLSWERMHSQSYNYTEKLYFSRGKTFKSIPTVKLKFRTTNFAFDPFCPPASNPCPDPTKNSKCKDDDCYLSGPPNCETLFGEGAIYNENDGTCGCDQSRGYRKIVLGPDNFRCAKDNNPTNPTQNIRERFELKPGDLFGDGPLIDTECYGNIFETGTREVPCINNNPLEKRKAGCYEIDPDCLLCPVSGCCESCEEQEVCYEVTWGLEVECHSWVTGGKRASQDRFFCFDSNSGDGWVRCPQDPEAGQPYEMMVDITSFVAPCNDENKPAWCHDLFNGYPAGHSPDKPDLGVPTLVNYDSPIREGDSIRVGFVIRNHGGVAAPNTLFEIKFEGADGSHGSDLGYTGSIAPYSSRVFFMESRDAGYYAPNATTHVTVKANSNESIDEFTLINNQSDMEVVTSPAPSTGMNLRALPITADFTNPVEGQWVTFNVPVKNDGLESTPQSDFFYQIVNDGNALESNHVHVPPLQPGEVFDYEFQYRSGGHGEHFIFVVVDSLWHVSESDEEDNDTVLPITFHSSAATCLECTSGAPNNQVGDLFCDVGPGGVPETGLVWKCMGVRPDGTTCAPQGAHPNGWSILGPRCPDPSELPEGLWPDLCGNLVCPGTATE